MTAVSSKLEFLRALIYSHIYPAKKAKKGDGKKVSNDIFFSPDSEFRSKFHSPESGSEEKNSKISLSLSDIVRRSVL